MRKFALIGLLLLVVLFVARNPGNAATLFRGLGAGAMHLADGLGNFASALTSGKH